MPSELPASVQRTGATSGSATPGSATPGSDTPGSDTPGSATPVNATPVNATPGTAAVGTSPDFEHALSELETLVERLERGDLPLEEALKTFERGVELTRHCQSALRSAQQKVEILLKRSGQTEVDAFSVSEDEGKPPSRA